MTTIRCLTMQKNETKLLEPWIIWHGSLFGFENLTIVDNGSTDPHVRDVQKRYEAKGVQIIRHYTSHADFLKKGDIFTDIIRKWDAKKACDFAIPMDCDEFLAYFIDRLLVRPEDILPQFDLLKNEQATLITDRVLLNIPDAPNYFRPQIITRALFRANTIRGLDRGLHAPRTIYPNRFVRTPFVCIHLHNRPDFEDMRRSARQKLALFEGTAPTKPAPSASQGSYHLHYYLQTRREDFVRNYLNTPDIYAPAIAARFRELGIDPAPLLGDVPAPQPPVNVPQNFLAHRRLKDGLQHDYILFDPLAYAHSNPDVTQDAHFGAWPLVHYLDTGWAEGRSANANGLQTFTLMAPEPQMTPEPQQAKEPAKQPSDT